MRKTSAFKKDDLGAYLVLSKEIRKEVLNLIYKTKSPHIGSCFSCVEILISLYFSFLSVSPKNPTDPNRDRFILSKGHACPALYAVLAKRGFLNKKTLQGFAVDGGSLEQHPSINIKMGIEVSSGSLGHGLSIGTGMALAAKKDGKKHKVYVLLSDGELNEGSTWEAIMFASHHKLDNLVAIVDYNKMQALGFCKDVINLEPLSERWGLFGWDVREVNGHNFQEIFNSFDSLVANSGAPTVIIAHTIKGKGVSFMENNLLWHYRAPDCREYRRALKELSDASSIF